VRRLAGVVLVVAAVIFLLVMLAGLVWPFMTGPYTGG
jgi:hypothetical protein